jgi:hypothetical protein
MLRLGKRRRNDKMLYPRVMYNVEIRQDMLYPQVRYNVEIRQA